MALECCTITVCFEDPFWVGIYERTGEDGYQVSKITFGAEPKDYQVYDFLLRSWRELNFSPVISGETVIQVRKNPKRARREIARQLSGPPVGTKAQEALKLQRAEGKAARQSKTRQVRQAEEERRFQLRQEKKKEKHRGH